jgi:branched-chain amino acid transport system permease protein
MSFDAIAHSLVYGIFMGSLYGLAAVGLALVFGVMRYLNIAHGYLLVLGGYVSYYLFSLYKVDPFLSIPLAMLTLFIIGAILYKLIYGSLAKLPEGGRIKNSLLISFGLGMVVQNASILLFSADERSITTSYSGAVLDIFGFRLPLLGLLGLGIAVVLIFALHLFLTRTYFGKSIRATSQDHEIATTMGVNVGRTYLISFAIGLALASVAGTMLVLGYAITPAIGQSWTMKSLILIVLAGMGRISGVFFAGILLGVVEAISVYFIGAEYREVVGLLLFILVLIFRPQGLFMRKAGEA